jgi:hypothetical protein
LRVVSGSFAVSFVATVVGRQYFVWRGVESFWLGGVLRISGS